MRSEPDLTVRPADGRGRRAAGLAVPRRPRRRGPGDPAPGPRCRRRAPLAGRAGRVAGGGGVAGRGGRPLRSPSGCWSWSGDWLQSLYVAPGHDRRRHRHRCCSTSPRACDPRGSGSTCSSPTPGRRRFYARHGFVEVASQRRRRERGGCAGRRAGLARPGVDRGDAAARSTRSTTGSRRCWRSGPRSPPPIQRLKPVAGPGRPGPGPARTRSSRGWPGSRPRSGRTGSAGSCRW